MALRTASVTGNWNNTATWGGSSIPVLGDHVVINDGITVTIPSGYTAVVGEATFDAITSNGTAGTGVLVVNGGLQIKTGNVLQGNAGWTFGAGATIEYDNASDAVWQISRDHVQGNAHLTINGTSGNHVTVRSTTAGGEMAFSDGGFLNGGLITATYCDFLRIGNASTNGSSFWIASSSVTYSLTDCTFDTCGALRTTSQVNGDSTLLLRRVRFLNSPGSDNLQLDGGNAVGTGVRELDSCVFDKNVNWFVTGTTIHECRFFGGLTSTTNADGTTGLTFFNNLLYSTASASPTTLPAGTSKDCYCVVDAATNPHFVQLSSSTGGCTVDGWVFECPNSATDGDVVIPTNVAGNIVKNCVLLPNSTGDSPGKLVSLLGGASTTIAIEHNTYVTSGAAETGVGFGETFAGVAGMITSFKSNLAWRPAGKTGGYKMRRIGGTTQNIVSAANANYNGNWNLAAGSDGNGYDGGATNVFSAGTPDVNGVSGDPGFVASSRNLAAWDASLGGAGTVANAIANLKALTAGYTVTALRTYIRAGFAPTAAAYDGTAHDAGDIGAVPFTASSLKTQSLAGTSTNAGGVTSFDVLVNSLFGVSSNSGALTPTRIAATKTVALTGASTNAGSLTAVNLNGNHYAKSLPGSSNNAGVALMTRNTSAPGTSGRSRGKRSRRTIGQEHQH